MQDQQTPSTEELMQEIGENIGFKVAVSEEHKVVILGFSKEVKTFAMGKEGAVAFANLILRQADKLK